MENTTTTSTKKVVEADVKKPRLTAAEFAKEFKRQWVLVAISVAYVIYGIIFYYRFVMLENIVDHGSKEK